MCGLFNWQLFVCPIYNLYKYFWLLLVTVIFIMTETLWIIYPSLWDGDGKYLYLLFIGSVKLKASEFVLVWSMCVTTWLIVIGNLCMQGALNATDLAPLLLSIKFSKVRSKSNNVSLPTPLYYLIHIHRSN